MRVLIAEDDFSVANALADALRLNDHQTEMVSRGSDVLLRHRDFDILLLDIGLEDGDSFDVISRLRSISTIPIIAVTARDDERSTVRALRIGADDYLVKPVRLQELLARIDVTTRRKPLSGGTTFVGAGSINIDLSAHRVYASGNREISLTPIEFAILAVLALRLGTAVSRDQVLDEVWGDAFAARSRSFDVHLTRLRNKLPNDVVITTLRGFGYRLEP